MTAIEPRGEWTTIPPGYGAKVSRAARFPVCATRSSSASGRWSPSVDATVTDASVIRSRSG
ncbi:hypothetical protein XF36_25440 [Pseudonocardia sp. HH130629-09]|nr:hypothetical protein XF36_25440 [Pseudonocardia sp. HH130629-09]